MFTEKNTTVIICAAGMGTRLGIGTTKALVSVENKPLIIRLLEQLDDYDDVRIAVGFQAEKLIEKVNAYRKDVLFAFNYEYETTGPAASVSKALLQTRENVLLIDGDLLVCPEDFKKFLAFDDECVCVTENSSCEPIWVDIKNDKATGFLKTKTAYEWAGIAKMKSCKLSECNSFVYEMIKPLLPMKKFEIRVKDIDTAEDYEKAEKWLKNKYTD